MPESDVFTVLKSALGAAEDTGGCTFDPFKESVKVIVIRKAEPLADVLQIQIGFKQELLRLLDLAYVNKALGGNAQFVVDDIVELACSDIQVFRKLGDREKAVGIVGDIFFKVDQTRVA